MKTVIEKEKELKLREYNIITKSGDFLIIAYSKIEAKKEAKRRNLEIIEIVFLDVFYDFKDRKVVLDANKKYLEDLEKTHCKHLEKNNIVKADLIKNLIIDCERRIYNLS